MTVGPRLRDGAGMELKRIVRAASRRPKTTIALWLLFVVGCVVAGGIAGTKTLDESEAGVGESSVADQRIAAAGMQERAVERILVRSGDPARTRAAAGALTERLRALPEVATAEGPADDAGLDDRGRAQRSRRREPAR